MDRQTFIGEIVKFTEELLKMPDTKTSPEMVEAIAKLVSVIKD